ncbi:MAG TPA: hypothetical protein EYM57_02295 [Gammaproteobacteria bacterium]|jgi:hypothetical protein|nr:hypothetical protein [Gammaproteobacteria bacterium]
MYVVRRWSVRHSRLLETAYQVLEAVLNKLHPLWNLARLEGAVDQQQEGIENCIELMQQIRKIDGIAGVHVMAYRQEEMVAEIIQKSGVLNGRSPSMPPQLENLYDSRSMQ